MIQLHKLDRFFMKVPKPLRHALRKYSPRWINIRSSISDYAEYKNICTLAYKHESVFDTFKSYEAYKKVLEHVTEEQGQFYLNVIKEGGEDLLIQFEKFRENDIYGSPATFTYDAGRISPTTLRYIKVLMDLKNIFGDLNGLAIIEIGAGYGGQCKIISDVINYRSYSIVDLDVVLQLIQKYLTKLNVKNVTYVSPNDITSNREYDLLISNYAFSECVKKIQDYYVDNVLKKAKRGYITYNAESIFDYKNMTTFDPLAPYNMKEITTILSMNHDIHVLDEIPKTASANFIIIWDDVHGVDIERLNKWAFYRNRL